MAKKNKEFQYVLTVHRVKNEDILYTLLQMNGTIGGGDDKGIIKQYTAH